MEPAAEGELVPVLRTSQKYAAVDHTSKRELGDDPKHLPLRRPFAEGCDDLLFGIATMEHSDGAVSLVQLLSEARLAALQLPAGTDPFRAAVATLARAAGPRLDGVTAAGPLDGGDSFQWLLRLKDGQKYGRLLQVATVGWVTTPLLLLPAMVRALCRVLRCPPAHLVVVPFDDDVFYAGSCTDPLAMCMLGDITTRPRASPKPVLSQLPFTVTDVSDTDDTRPVAWEKYQCHGTPFGLVGYDMQPQYVVPVNEAAADALATAMHGGEAPPLRKLQFTDQCWGCRQASGVVQLKGCAKCRTAVYCSAECQKEDWKQHKAFCQETCASGRLGTGPAAPTLGTAVLTPFTYRLR